MKRLYVAMSAGILALFCIAYWKNSVSYSFKSLRFRLGKSTIDTLLVIVAALKAPALLVGWTVMWLTRPIARRGVQVTLAVILGIVFGAIGGVALEVLCVLGVIAVDLFTGSQGVYGWWTQGPPNNFASWLSEAGEVKDYEA